MDRHFATGSLLQESVLDEPGNVVKETLAAAVVPWPVEVTFAGDGGFPAGDTTVGFSRPKTVIWPGLLFGLLPVVTNVVYTSQNEM